MSSFVELRYRLSSTWLVDPFDNGVKLMAKTPNVAYRVCGAYVDDLEPCLSDELVKQVRGYIRARRYDLLAALPADPSQHSMEEFSARRQISAFFKKNADFVDDHHCYEVALQSFRDSEAKCQVTNQVIDAVHRKILQPLPLVSEALPRMRNYIESALGDYKSFVNQLPELIRLTNGATSTRSRRESQAFMKLTLKPAASSAASPMLNALYKWFNFPSPAVKHCDWNRVEFVPKNYKTHRTIACEPEGNLPLQLAFDAYAKDRLRKRGIDLSDQFYNQSRARQGSVDGRLATIDLSAASDSVALNAVVDLFPDDWFAFLNAVRSPAYQVGKETVADVRPQVEYYHKYASMGNGTTFVVETLIFAAACYGVGSEDFSVYGDDIILEAEKVPELKQVLDFLGFAINQEKSFVAGPFRESCGLDSYNGVDITPFYLGGTPRNKPGWCHLVNGMVSIGVPNGALWKLARDLTRDQNLPLVPYGPDSLSGVWVDVQTAYRLKLIRNTRDKGRRTYLQHVRAYVTVPRLKAQEAQDTKYQGLTLWYLERSSKERAFSTNKSRIPPVVASVLGATGAWLDEAVSDPHIRSKVQLDVTYKRKWVPWFPPGGVPLHLFGWVDYLVA